MTETIEKTVAKSHTGIWGVIAFWGLYAWILGSSGAQCSCPRWERCSSSCRPAAAS
jgi:hypothetical protein